MFEGYTHTAITQQRKTWCVFSLGNVGISNGSLIRAKPKTKCENVYFRFTTANSLNKWPFHFNAPFPKRKPKRDFKEFRKIQKKNKQIYYTKEEKCKKNCYKLIRVLVMMDYADNQLTLDIWHLEGNWQTVFAFCYFQGMTTRSYCEKMLGCCFA